MSLGAAIAGPVSGGHISPAVTIAMAVFCKFVGAALYEREWHQTETAYLCLAVLEESATLHCGANVGLYAGHDRRLPCVTRCDPGI